MKKILLTSTTIILLLCLPFCIFSSNKIVAKINETDNAAQIDIKAPVALLMEFSTGQIIYSKNTNEKKYPASMTKLMTAIVAVEYTQPDTIITVGNEIYMIDPQSSRAYLTVGTRLTMENLLQAMLLPSGNDAAHVLAAAGGRVLKPDAKDGKDAVAAFMAGMNDYAKKLGLTKSNFITPDGYDTEAGNLSVEH